VVGAFDIGGRGATGGGAGALVGDGDAGDVGGQGNVAGGNSGTGGHGGLLLGANGMNGLTE
jgi:hypothetical protein